jgi:hypothetical protein
MNWTMPRPVLQIVAAIIGVASVGSFALGVATAPARGRLPGEKLDGVTGQVIQAQDATPLTDERIQGAAPPAELSDEEKARLADEKEAREEAAAIAKAEAAGVTPVTAAAPAAAPAATETPAAAPPPPPPAKAEEPPF